MSARVIMWTGVAGTVGVLLLALPELLPPAVANDQPMKTLLSSAQELFAPAVDPDALVRWDFTVDPSVSTEPVKQSTVKKIAYGRASTVQVVETATGVYSSDAMTDPHIQYPGITKTYRGHLGGLAWWTGHGWHLAMPFTAGSFVHVVPFKGGKLVVTDGGTCVVTRKSLIC